MPSDADLIKEFQEKRSVLEELKRMTEQDGHIGLADWETPRDQKGRPLMSNERVEQYHRLLDKNQVGRRGGFDRRFK